MKISYRLAVGFGLLLFLMIGLSSGSITQVNSISANLDQINHVNAVKQRYAINYRGSVHDRAIAIRDVALVTSVGERKAAEGLIAELASSYAENEKKMAQMISRLDGATAVEQAILAEIASIQAATNPVVAEIIQLQSAGATDEAKTLLLEQARPLFVQWLAAINKFIDYQENLNKSIGASVSESTDDFQSVTLAALAVAIVIAIAIAFFTGRSIISPISKLRLALLRMAEGDTTVDASMAGRRDELGDLAAAVSAVRNTAALQAEEQARSQAARSEGERRQMEEQAAERSKQANALDETVCELGNGLEAMAVGNLTYRIEKCFQPEFDQLRSNFNNSIERLQSTVERISEVAASLHGGTRQISSATNSLAKRTEQQAASVEETAAALEQISTTVQDSTRRAEEAGSLVEHTKEKAEKSGDVVAQAVAAMGGIETSSREVSNIISVIDEIAFQTNLLALNAGVEAARAGEAGKGFAVVAQEVRELAQRSATAAREIKQLIGTSTEHVRKGVEYVGQTGEALNVIVGDVQEISRHVRSIVEAAREQSTGP